MQDRENYTLTAKDGTALTGYEWLVDEPKAVICMVHGLGEHMGRYHHVAEYFNDKDFAFYGFDLRGHGLSEGKRGHTPPGRNGPGRTPGPLRFHRWGPGRNG